MNPYRVDDIEVVSILDGAEDLTDPIEENYPSVPAEAWPDVRSTHPEVVLAAGTWRLYVRCTLIRLPGRTILVDTGVGHLVAPAWFGATGKLADGLGAAGVQREGVDTVVITHVHDDHIGGTVTGAGAPAFPNARFVLQRADLEWQRSFAQVDEEDRVIYDTLLRPLEDAGMIHVVDGDAELGPNVRLRHAPGHTPGHQMVAVAGRESGLLVSGDLFNHPMQVAHPGLHSTRGELLRRLGRTEEARDAYLRALALVHDDAERRLLERLAELGGAAGPTG